MYCPSCRVNISNESVCPKCGKDLSALGKIHGKKMRNIYGLIISDLIIIGVAYFFIHSIIWFVCFIIVLGLASLTLYMGPIKNLGNLAPVGKCCPKCYNMYLNDDYCMECGYDLRDVLGFSYYTSTFGNYDLQIGKEYIKITKYNYAQGHKINACSNSYPVEHMRNLRVSDKCRQGVIHTPCLMFDFNPQVMERYHKKQKSNNTFKIPILKPIAPYIKNVINDPLFEKARSNDPFLD